ncbi:MAG: glyoxylate/hydroxypyruvate reductase A [Nitratireductor sp.]
MNQTVAKRILMSVTGWDPSHWVRQFKVHAPDREVVLEPDGRADPSIRYAVVWKQPPGILADLPNLEAIFSLGAGVDHIFRDNQLPDVPIVRIVADDLTMRMSEYVVWQVLDQLRQGNIYRAQQKARVWHEGEQPSARDVTVGIMGLGVLGCDAAAKLTMLGFRVAGWSRSPKAVAGVDCHHGEAGLTQMLGTSDIIVVLLPLTDETRGIINSGLLGKLKRGTPLGGPVLINAGRGGLQVEADILAALDDGRLMAASLDVFETEPLPEESPLWAHPRVFVTPHAAAVSDPRHLVPQMLRQMRQHEAGQPFSDVVDRKAGY